MWCNTSDMVMMVVVVVCVGCNKGGGSGSIEMVMERWREWVVVLRMILASCGCSRGGE